MCSEKYEEIIERLKSAKNNEIKDIRMLEKKCKLLFSDKTDVFVEIANYYIRNNDIDRAILNLVQYKKNGGNKIAPLLLLAKLYVKKKEYTKTERLLKELMVNDNVYISTKKEVDEIMSFYIDHSANFFHEYICKQKRLKKLKKSK